MTDYSKWDNLESDSDSDSGADAPPPAPARVPNPAPPPAPPAPEADLEASLSSVFTLAQNQFSSGDAAAALRTYSFFLNSCSPPPEFAGWSPSPAPLSPSAPPPLPPLPASYLTAPPPSSAKIPAPLLLRLYSNLSACHLSLGDLPSALHYAAGATEVVETNGLTQSNLPLDTVLARTKAYHFSGACQLRLAQDPPPGTAGAGPRPLLLRAKEHLKSALHSMSSLGPKEQEKLNASDIEADLRTCASLLNEFLKKASPPLSNPLPPGTTAADRVISGSYQEGMQRYRQGQLSASLECFKFAAESWEKSDRSNPATASLMVLAYSLQAKVTSEIRPSPETVAASAKILEEIDGKCKRAPLSKRRPASLLRKAGLMYQKARRLDDAARCILEALRCLGVTDVDVVAARVESGAFDNKRGEVGDEVAGGQEDARSEDARSEDVFELDASGNMTPVQSESPPPPLNIMSILSNMISLAGIYSAKKEFSKALKIAVAAISVTDTGAYMSATEEEKWSPEKRGLVVLSIYEVQSDCLAGARDFAASRAVAEEAAALAEKLGEWARASSMYVSMGHIERVSDRLDEAAAMFGKACEMYERGGEFLMSGATYLKAASFLQKPQAMDLPTARKNTIVEMLKKSLAAFKKAPKSANRSKGQFDANRALGFCYQSYFDYATNDELDVDAALAAFKDARDAFKAGGDGVPAESRARVCLELGNCCAKRRQEGDLRLAEIAFEEAAKGYAELGSLIKQNPPPYAQELDISRRSLDQVKKMLERV
ncbi:hypothetical protein TeGR_g11342 [Tetraparma gracilis]|uniref:Uncharacterized protein n=1 Tax=Tetraparma gracilis TaxID=2962635 RepID=A0ABQ6MSR8_9STRA|nr:hypothetical protein TeGR_g11342 [Tetraparma gracilis]